ncbi:YveK family protein [Listeria grandensis]|uniref:YveK family protein n=1 Tax=Listeria grandensis TaxID=1494963 RepID=UPI00164EBDE0|nr:Wzz/FepE/Etk N-terminal domain-containing protein [Listeria grandensis]MBC6316189.1 hypothetical protein [Listeria grandensis]
MEKMIDFRIIVKHLKQYFWILMLASIIGIGGTTFWLMQIAVPKYQASADIFVKPQKIENEGFRLDSNTNNRLISTYSGILKSHTTIDQVKEKLKLKEDFKTITTNLSIKNENESQIISISYQANSPEQAVKVVNTTVQIMQLEVSKLFENSTVKLLSGATVEDATIPISPNIKISLALGLFIGLVAGIIVITIMILTNNTIREDEDIEEITNIPIIGEVEKW